MSLPDVILGEIESPRPSGTAIIRAAIQGDAVSLLEMVRGDTVTLDVALTDGDGNPLDLTDLGLTFTAVNASMTITKTLDDGITLTDDVGGLATVELVPDDTSDLEDRVVLAWDLQVSDDDGHVHTPLMGSLIVETDVSP